MHDAQYVVLLRGMLESIGLAVAGRAGARLATALGEADARAVVRAAGAGASCVVVAERTYLKITARSWPA
jgi:uncharacterized membrane protein YfcA